MLLKKVWVRLKKEEEGRFYLSVSGVTVTSPFFFTIFILIEIRFSVCTMALLLLLLLLLPTDYIPTFCYLPSLEWIGCKHGFA